MIERRVIVIVTCAILSITGCVSDRSTPAGPEGSTGLPAMSVLDDPVLGLTDWVRTPDSLNLDARDHAIPIPFSVYSSIAHVDDIALGLSGPVDTVPGALELFDYELGAWRAIEFWSRDSVCPVRWSGPHNLLSAHSDDPDASFLGPDRVLRIRGDAQSPIVQLYDYHPEYTPVRVAPMLMVEVSRVRYPIWPTAQGLAVVGGELWAILAGSSDCIGTRGLDDWLVVIDTTGTIIGRTNLGSRQIEAITLHDGEVWILMNQGRTLAILGRDGTITEKFSLPPNEGSARWSYNALVSAMGRLFVADPISLTLLGVLTDESGDSGVAVIDWRFSFRAPLWWRLGIAWDGAYFYTLNGPRLTQYNLSQQITGYWHLPVGRANDSEGSTGSTNDFVWDGKSFWLLHYGPHRLASTGLMLSRFKLPEGAR
jgi:hypothetical protein